MSLKSVLEDSVQNYCAQHSIIDPAKIKKISDRIAFAANGILTSARGASKQGVKETTSTFVNTSVARKYDSLLTELVQKAWDITISAPAQAFYGSGVKIKTYSVFKITWSDEIMRPKPTFQAFQTTMKADFSCFRTFREQRMYTDVILCVDGEEIPVHRIVLAARSTFFQKAFGSGMKESQFATMTLNVGELGSDKASFKEFIDFLYTDQIDLKKRSISDIGKILTLAQFYSVDSLLNACVYELSERVSPENAQEIHDLSYRLGTPVAAAENSDAKDEVVQVYEPSLQRLIDLCKWRAQACLEDLEKFPCSIQICTVVPSDKFE